MLEFITNLQRVDACVGILSNAVLYLASSFFLFILSLAKECASGGDGLSILKSQRLTFFQHATINAKLTKLLKG